jgi:hypothetical protein
LALSIAELFSVAVTTQRYELVVDVEAQTSSRVRRLGRDGRIPRKRPAWSALRATYEVRPERR